VIAEDIVDEDFSLFPRNGHQNQFARGDSSNYISDTDIKRVFAQRHNGKRSSKFSPTLLDIPEGKSAIFVYRLSKAFELYGPPTVPVMINDKFLSRLLRDDFECVIVEPGMSTLIYPSRASLFGDTYENTLIIREPIETNSNEIVFLSVKAEGRAVSVVSSIEKETVDLLKGTKRAGIQIINQ
jgi:hypothetical protein